MDLACTSWIILSVLLPSSPVLFPPFPSLSLFPLEVMSNFLASSIQGTLINSAPVCPGMPLTQTPTLQDLVSFKDPTTGSWFYSHLPAIGDQLWLQKSMLGIVRAQAGLFSGRKLDTNLVDCLDFAFARSLAGLMASRCCPGVE